MKKNLQFQDETIANNLHQEINKKRPFEEVYTKSENVPQPKPAKIKKKTFREILEKLDEKVFTCYFCDKVFSEMKYLRSHHKRHLDEEGNYPCRYYF